MVRKELHLDEKIISALEAEAKRQNRSLKNYLEFLAIEQARKLEIPSKEYTQMMDDLLSKMDSGKLQFSNIEEVLNRNGVSH